MYNYLLITFLETVIINFDKMLISNFDKSYWKVILSAIQKCILNLLVSLKNQLSMNVTICIIGIVS
jgi:hypothetical protein